MEYCRWLSQQDGQGLSAADRGGVGIRLPGRHQDGLFLRRRSQGPRRLCLVRGHLGGNHAPVRHQEAQPVGPLRHVRQHPGMVPGSLQAGLLRHVRPGQAGTEPGADCRPTRASRTWPAAVPGPTKAEQCRSATRRGSDKSWIKSDPQRPQSIWWLTKTDFIGFRIVRAVTEQDNLKGLRSKVTRQSKN